MASVNNPITTSESRNPRSIVMVNGTRAEGVISWEVENNSYYQADTFQVHLSLYGQLPQQNWAWWAAQTDFAVEILVGFPPDPINYQRGDLLSLLLGQVDDVDIDPTLDKIVLSGRDYTSKLIDTKTTEKFLNETLSEVVTALAKRHSMVPQVAPTVDRIGKYYEIDRVVLSHQMSEWDLLNFLARFEDQQILIQGNNLIMRQRQTAPGPAYILQWENPDERAGYFRSNVVRINFSHNMTLAKDVIVIVKSWNQKQKTVFRKKAQATHNKSTVLAGGAQPIGEAQTYEYTIPNLTPEQALQKAESLLREITQHEVRVTAELHGNDVLTMDNSIQVIGTGTLYDQVYFPSSIVRAFSYEDGYRMHVVAKNHMTESQVAG